MDIDKGLLEKYRALLSENSMLREEKGIVKARLGITTAFRMSEEENLFTRLKQRNVLLCSSDSFEGKIVAVMQFITSLVAPDARSNWCGE